jgi:hypothetical protein
MRRGGILDTFLACSKCDEMPCACRSEEKLPTPKAPEDSARKEQPSAGTTPGRGKGKR